MRRIIAAIGVMSFLGLTGCATEEFVRSQTDPLSERIGKLETRMNALEGLAAKGFNLTDTDKALLRQALDAAKKAEEAAKAAENAEKKSEKLFRLEQKK
jgi:uncharacterized membrane protein